MGGLRAVVCGNELFVAVSLAKVGLFELGFQAGALIAMNIADTNAFFILLL